MANTPVLTVEEAQKLKADMFGGMKYDELQDKYHVSYQMVVGIKAGRNYRDVPWPDGSLGKMPQMQAARNRDIRKYNSSVNNSLTNRFGEEEDEKVAYARMLLRRAGSEYTLEQLDEMTREKTKGKMNSYIEVLEFMGKLSKGILEEEAIKREKQEEEERNKRIAEFEALPKKEQRKILKDISKGPTHLPADQCDPDGGVHKLEWDTIIKLAADNPLVQAAEDYEAMKQAIMIVFDPVNNFISIEQWNKDIAKDKVFSITKKIEHFWALNPDRAPVMGDKDNTIETDIAAE